LPAYFYGAILKPDPASITFLTLLKGFFMPLSNNTLSFASWNVEHFTSDPARCTETVNFIKESDPDIFGLFEVNSKDVFHWFINLMPTHSFFISESIVSINTLIGIRREYPVFITQRDELKSKMPTLRPGVIATVKGNAGLYTFLYVHLKSFQEPRSFGLRDDMFEHILNLKTRLDKAENGRNARFISLGDFNTMGMNLTYSDKDIDENGEIARILDKGKRRGMILARKTASATWWNGSGTSGTNSSDLDHVLYSESVALRDQGNAKIDVRGWPRIPDEAGKRAFVSTMSDHAMLYGEIIDEAE
jgi:hypothetical protein